MSSTQAEKYLRWLMIVIGCGLMVAFFFVLLPGSQMQAAHQWLGLGEFPDAPISFYLARSTSLLYGIHGTLMLLVGLRMKKHSDLVPVFGWLHVAIGLCMLGVDLSAGMPWWWTAFEGIPIAMAGLAIVWLYRKSELPEQNTPSTNSHRTHR